MAKKKSKEAAEYEALLLEYGMPEPPKRPGRRPKVPDNLPDVLDDINRHAAAWLRRCDDVWCNFTTIALLEIAKNSLEYDGIPERYADAIELLECLADRAEGTIKRLKEGKALAEKRLAQQRASGGKQKPAKKRSSAPKPTQDEDYFGLNGG